MVRFGKPDLAKLHAERDLDGLVKALRHKRPEVRREAAERLGWLGDARAEMALLDHVNDADESVRGAAAKALGGLRDNRILEQMRVREETLLASGDPDALARFMVEERSRPAMRALLRCDESAATKALEKLGAIRTARFLVEIMPPSIRVLDADERGHLAVDFGRFETVGDLEDRCAAVRLLDLLWSEEVSNDFHDEFESKAKYCAQNAGTFAQRTEALSEARLLAAKLGMRARPLLSSIRERWAKSKERWESGSDFFPTQSAADAMTRTAYAIEASTLNADLELLDSLLQRLLIVGGDPSESVLPATVLEALREGEFLGTRDSPNRTSRTPGEIFDKVYDIIRPRSVGALLETYDELEPAPRTGFLRALERDLGDQVVEPAIAGLTDADPAIRAAAAEVLGQLGFHRVVDPLIVATKDSDPRVRTLAAVALGLLGERIAVPALTQLVDDPTPSVAQASREALDLLRPEE